MRRGSEEEEEGGREGGRAVPWWRRSQWTTSRLPARVARKRRERYLGWLVGEEGGVFGQGGGDGGHVVGPAGFQEAGRLVFVEGVEQHVWWGGRGGGMGGG